MIILAIETSCDETAIAIIDYESELGLARIKKSSRISADKSQSKSTQVHILANLVSSQIEIHKPFGGVVPNLARREHEINLVPILIEALKKAKMLNMEFRISNLESKKMEPQNSPSKKDQPLASKFQILNSILEREPILLDRFIKNILPISIPEIDAIAVTYGPGLAPALWVGVNFAKALSFVWEKPLIPVNHMEGHIFSALLRKREKDNLQFTIYNLQFPALALLVSGGHTELVLINKLGKYKIIGETIDDAAGEAFDKVARILNLPYPGGPEISRLACLKTKSYKLKANLPRPMLHSKDFNFSFSGLKTAVLYLVRDLKKTREKAQFSDNRCPGTENDNILDIGCRAAIAKEFQDAVVEVLVAKTVFAAKIYKAKTVILGGGVAANYELRKQLGKMLKYEIHNSKFYIPNSKHTGDNALMIALAAAVTGKKKPLGKIRVESNLRFN
ncbi:MAG: tRNA (adenosine(37)-N6)-threonylcarbamoyltransferase complex transferase subunit TsaD [bacterium]|nr:tRNA (adenosine(37)-N6)-threonylcarbamoyltransferase complex transferase subunit TsaD [bacterium]